MEKKLYLSETNKVIAGVCGGIGEYFGIDPTVIRLIWVILSVPSLILGGGLVYLIAMLVIPKK
ncbi:MAG TPA: PspC domain-containing protein [Ruminiclostridium sp.]|jgi:phage shock protein PspC (stress-responsive transcriptional regulator)|nr:PspC domain-containing protein [Clostridiaceae bacterium]HAA24584.1 PspC domain-containing protein [Ruminiclostridium sp.]